MNRTSENIKQKIGFLLFFSRWILLPIYIGLIAMVALYSVKFSFTLWHVLESFSSLDERKMMIAVLELIDIAMVANLIIVVIFGGYEIFVNRMRIDSHPDQPEWLNHVSTSMLKLKISLTIITISSIELLQTFLNISKFSNMEIAWQVILHVTFLGSAIVIAIIDCLINKSIAAQAIHEKNL